MTRSKRSLGGLKGWQNEIVVEVECAIALAFEGIAGPDALVKWASKSLSNRMLFYSKLYAQLIPLPADRKPKAEADKELLEALERALARVVGARKGKEKAASVAIDAEPDRAAVTDIVPTA
jgi:hypothetical protein